ncbi:MAG: hypothetical protein BroJett011_25690 [Chloroflexota bacterium]|nr:MAG: hypothetical protein BroJett011_25690 [Chloroflexota bacterium]
MEGWKIGRMEGWQNIQPSSLAAFHENANETLDSPILANLAHTRCLHAERYHTHADDCSAGTLGADTDTIPRGGR